MNSDPIWRLVQDAARELTREKIVPFTRKDIIERIHRRLPGLDTNSINPTIQGVTDNLKGGAPGADGKRVLHSVGRGQFVLYSKRDEINAPSLLPEEKAAIRKHKSVRLAGDKHPKTERELQSQILAVLQQTLARRPEIDLSEETQLWYTIDGDHRLSHSSDILARGPGERVVSIELKYKSSVTDQFKCRAYDALHMKQEYGDKLLTIMLYVRAQSGISIGQAKRISYPFDLFFGVTISELAEGAVLDEIAEVIESFLFNK